MNDTKDRFQEQKDRMRIVQMAPHRVLTYLACPYAHSDTGIMQQRYEKVTEVAGRLLAIGIQIYSPITHHHPMACVVDLPRGWDFWKKIDTKYLEVSREMLVLLLEGWDRSVGVGEEMRIAYEMGIPIYTVNPETLEVGVFNERIQFRADDGECIKRVYVTPTGMVKRMNDLHMIADDTNECISNNWVKDEGEWVQRELKDIDGTIPDIKGVR